MDEERVEELNQWVMDQRPHCERCGSELEMNPYLSQPCCTCCSGDTIHPFGYIAENELREAFISEFGEEEWEDYTYVEPPDEWITDYNDPEDIVYGPTFDKYC